MQFFCGLITTGSCPIEKKHLELMMKDLIEEGLWNRNPQFCGGQAFYASEQTEDITMCTRMGWHGILFERSVKILGYACNQAGQTLICFTTQIYMAVSQLWTLIVAQQVNDAAQSQGLPTVPVAISRCSFICLLPVQCFYDCHEITLSQR